MEFRVFAASRLAGIAAAQIQSVVLAWVVYQITGDPFHLGLVGLFIFLPSILFLLLTGQTADRFDRRWVMAIAYMVAGSTALILMLMVWNGVHNLWVIYGLIFIYGTARAFSFPASQAILPNLVPRRHFANAVALNSSIFQTATIGGPMLGGVLVDVGSAFAFGVAGTCYLISALLLLFLKKHQAEATGTRVTLKSLFSGFRYIWREKPVLGAISLDLFAVLLGGATALLPIYASDILDVGSAGFGLLRSMPGLGAVFTALYIARWPLNRHMGAKMLIAVAIFGFATVGFGLSTNLWFSLVCLFVMGSSDMISVYVRQTLVQLETPDDMRGRVSAVNSVFIGASNELGEFESGLLASAMGTIGAVVVGGVGTIAIAALWAWLFPALRDRDQLVAEEVAEEEEATVA